MRYWLCFLLTLGLSLEGRLIDHFKRGAEKTGCHSIKHIDCIYVVNLDQCPEKFERCVQQFAPWGILPCRFSAIHGEELCLETVRSVGVKYKKSVICDEMLVTCYNRGTWNSPIHEFAYKRNRTYFCHGMSLASIGTCLSHLSVLQDAYNAGYKTVWIMDDGIEVVRSPHLLSDFIKQLDQTVGKDGWDILFTDRDARNSRGEYVVCTSLPARLNFIPSNSQRFAQRWDVTPEIRCVGARFGAYSMIVRRSGMKKLLNYFKRYKIFFPFDVDLCMPDDIRLFTVIDDVVTSTLVQ